MLKDVLVPIIAIAGFLQYWIIGAYRAWFKRGRLEIHESAKIKITFDHDGHSIGLLGALRAINRDVFVKSIQVRVKKLEDNSGRLFEPTVFLSPKFGTKEPHPMELPHAFLVPIKSEHLYNIPFVDASSRGATDEYKKVRQELFQQERRISEENPEDPKTDDYWRGLRLSIIKGSEKLINDLKDHINQNLYWSQGRYQLTILVSTDIRNAPFEKSFYFELEQAEFDNLQKNTRLIIENLGYDFLGLDPLWLYSTYADYEQE